MTTYLIKMVLCSAILLIVYKFLFEKEKMHRFNRFYLAMAILVSFVLPLIEIEWSSDIVTLDQALFSFDMLSDSPTIITNLSGPNIEKEEWKPDLLQISYGLITIFLLIRFIKNLSFLTGQIRRNTNVSYKNAKLVLLDEQLLPYSFLGYIFINKSEFQDGQIEDEILHHELAHVKQRHSLDILLLELLLVFAWLNPFFFLYKKAIRLNHEFLADEEVVKAFRNPVAYQLLLLRKASAQHSLLASPFNFIITKMRLTMMTKKISSTAMLKQFSVAPLLALIVFIFSTRVEAMPAAAGSNREETKAINEIPGLSTASDTTKPPPAWLGLSIGYSKAGASPELIREFEAILGKYPVQSWTDVKKITSTDKQRLETIFKQMSKKQQLEQKLVFVKPLKPRPKATPTETQFNNLKNPKVFGIWIDEKRVPNSVLNKYSNTDFSQVSISKLYGAAKKGRTYTHQADLMTNAYYQKYYNERMADQETKMLFKSDGAYRFIN